MENFKKKLLAYFTKRNTFKVVVIELIVMGLLLCALLAMSVDVEVRLRGEQIVTLQTGAVFHDPGATATADGKVVEVTVSGKVDTDTPGTYTLCYRARYLLSSGKAYRTVRVVRAAEPTIVLTGGTEITVPMGTQFQEPGYTATAAHGADLTGQVQIAGTVDTMTAGSYVLTYTVTDDAGRTASIQRSVTVEPAKQPAPVQPEGKVIYLTFDDGPGQYTQELLEVLKKYNAKATFFVVKTGYGNRAEVMKQIVEQGHAIGIHSVTHEWSIYDSEAAFMEDLYGMQAVIREATGVTTTLMRFPGGSSNTISKKHCAGIMTALTKKVTDLGFQYFDWDVDSNDAGGAKTADAVYNNVVKGIGSRKTAVVLQHDIKAFSVEAVERIIKWGLENGYSFQSLTAESPACHHAVNN